MAKTNSKPAKGLGTGLGALFGDAASEAANDFEYIAVERLEPRRDQPRVTFAQEPLEELSLSIREHGVISPITVRPTGEGFYEIIAGERRWRAARMAELEEVPARVLNVDDRTAMELSLIENLQRENLNPVEEALGYRALGEDYGLTQEEIAQRMGKSRPAIANAMRLLSMPDEVLKMLQSGDIAAGSARALLAISNKNDMIIAAREVVHNGMTTREAEQLAKKYNRIGHAPKPRSSPVNYMAEFEERLATALGRRVKIVGTGKNSGRVTLEYYGEDDFEQLCDGLLSLGEEI